MVDDDKIYELVEQIRNDLDDLRIMVWNATGDRDLHTKILNFMHGSTPEHQGIDAALDAVLEAAGIELCEHCGERVENCTCDDDTGDAEQSVDSVEA